MTPKEQRSLVRYIHDRAQDLRLGTWTIYVHFDEAPDGANAAVACIDNRKIANLSLSPAFADLSPEEQRQTILHELIHIHLWQITLYVEKAIPELIGKPAYVVFSEALTAFDEQATDAIAAAIADRYPIWVP